MRLSRGTALMFQRARSATGPWRRLPDQADQVDLFNTYCITVSTGQTVFGGVHTAEFVTPPTGTFRLSPKTPACPGSRPASTSTSKSRPSPESESAGRGLSLGRGRGELEDARFRRHDKRHAQNHQFRVA
jgi:hypothetical protein